MFWKRVILENYLPFSHCGNRKVTIDFVKPTTAILGGNGSGKSSLLRALNPYPAVRTDFGSKGKIVKVLEHGGHIYELESDFSNSVAPHSFKKDDVELNLSHTTETQKDLIDEHFGMSKIIDDIVAGNIKICSTSKADRRALFSSMYPSNLSFVIEYHKRVCSQIRACGNQLKLLNSREATIRSSLIDEEERRKLERFREGATDLIDRIDKTQLLLEAESDRYKNAPNFRDQCHYSYTGWNKLDVRDEILCLGMDVLRGFRQTGIRKKLRDDFTPDAISVIGFKHAETARNTRDHISRITSQVEETRDELNRFIQAREANASIHEKTQLEDRFNICQSELDEVNKKIGIDQHDVISSDVIDHVEGTILPYVINWVESFHASAGSLISKDELISLGVKLDHARVSLSGDLSEELASVTLEIQQVTTKLSRLESRPYPKDCVTVCPLRSSVEDTLNSTRDRLKVLTLRKSELSKQQQDLTEFIEKNGSFYQEQKDLHTTLDTFLVSMRQYNLESIIFSGEDPISCCKEHCFEISNRLARACTNTRLHMQKQSLVTEMESIRHTLSTMAATKQLQMSVDLIESTIKDREEKLDLGINEIIKLEELAEKEEKKSQTIKKISDDYRQLEYRVNDAYLLMNQERVELIIKFFEDLILELAVAKHDLQEELYSVSKILQEQQKSIDILESEILPTAEKVKHQKEVYEAVADGLSPTSGLPCIYLIRFINRLLTRANDIIRDVWFYDMELKYLQEGEDLDFSLPVIIRNSTEVKDVSICSMGQKAIIDLAMTFAICIERGFLNWNAIRLDECDAALTDDHRTRLVGLLNKLTEKGIIKQMFLVNHFAIQTGMSNCDSVCLNPEGILVPEIVNENAVIG